MIGIYSIIIQSPLPRPEGREIPTSCTGGDSSRIVNSLLSEEDYRGLLETVHLCSIPGMVESIKAVQAEPREINFYGELPQSALTGCQLPQRGSLRKR